MLACAGVGDCPPVTSVMSIFAKAPRSRSSRAALRRRAAARERARLGRELHDGVMQGLSSIDMQLETMLRGFPSDAAEMVDTVVSVQNRIRAELMDMRALIEDCRSDDVAPDHLSDALTEVVWRFNRRGDIAAACFTPPDGEVKKLPRRVCTELVRVVREGLVNVRRHSGARNVMVELVAGHAEYTLSITDDGHGFGGRLPPVVITERVHNIGGTLTLAPAARGARIVITIPRGGPWKHVESQESRWLTTIRSLGLG